jgi:hypothetical protein
MSDHGVHGAIRDIIANLPEKLHGIWLNLNHIHAVFKQGGFALLPRIAISDALRGSRSHPCTIPVDVVDRLSVYRDNLNVEIMSVSYYVSTLLTFLQQLHVCYKPN